MTGQIWHYFTWIKKQSYDEINDLAKKKHMQDYHSIDQKFNDYFKRSPDKWNSHQKLIIVGEKIDFDDRNDPRHDVQNCYYGRDRGEKDVGYKKHLNGVCLLDEAFNCSEEFLYIFKETKDGVWEWFYVDEYKDSKTPIPLKETAIRDHIGILKRVLDQMKIEKQSI